MSEPSAQPVPTARDWIMGDIAVDESGLVHTYPFAMLLSFGSLDDFRAARKLIAPFLFSSEGSRNG